LLTGQGKLLSATKMLQYCNGVIENQIGEHIKEIPDLLRRTTRPVFRLGSVSEPEHSSTPRQSLLTFCLSLELLYQPCGMSHEWFYPPNGFKIKAEFHRRMAVNNGFAWDVSQIPRSVFFRTQV
jgi:hypothetical protein